MHITVSLLRYDGRASHAHGPTVAPIGIFTELVLDKAPVTSRIFIEVATCMAALLSTIGVLP
jgi:hypothetical protein